MKTLKILRIKFGYTQAELASKIGVTSHSIYQYESGRRKPDLKKLKLLCKLFDCKIDDLID